MKFPFNYLIPSLVIIALTPTELTLRLAYGLGHPALI